MNLLMMMFGASLLASAQFPAVQNGQVDVQQASSVAEAVGRAGRGAEPVWIGWSVPMVRGERSVCSTWSSQNQSVRGMYLEGWVGTAGTPPPFAVPTGPVRLEAGTNLVVLVRLIEGQVDRIRMVADDCPIDAGNRRLIRLDGISGPGSVTYLETFLAADSTTAARQRGLAASALSAIALHEGAAADEALERLVRVNPESEFSRQAASWMARARGRRAFARLLQLLDSAATSPARRMLVAAIAQSPEPETYDTLQRLATTHADERVRVEAVRAISNSADPRAKRYLEDVLRR